MEIENIGQFRELKPFSILLRLPSYLGSVAIMGLISICAAAQPITDSSGIESLPESPLSSPLPFATPFPSSNTEVHSSDEGESLGTGTSTEMMDANRSPNGEETTGPNPTPTPYPEPAPEEKLQAGNGFLGFFEFGETPLLGYNESRLTLPYAAPPEFNFGYGRKRVGPFRYGLSLSAGVSHTDNVFGSGTNRKGDFIMSFTPAFFLEAGTRGLFRFVYSPSFQNYARFKQQNFTNETLLLTIRYRWTKLKLNADFNYVTRNGLFPDSNGTANQSSYYAHVTATYPVGKKLSSETRYVSNITNSDPGGVNIDNSLGVALDYHPTARLSFGVEALGGVVSADPNDQAYTQLGLRGNYRVNTRLEFKGNAGAQVRQLSTNEVDSSTVVSPVFGLGAAWHHPSSSTTLYFNLYRNIQNNTFDSLQTNIYTGANIGLTQIFWRRITFSGNCGLSYTEQVGNTNQTTDRYMFFNGNISLSYQFLRALNLQFFYNYQQRASHFDTSSYYTNIIGISLNTNF